MKKIILNEENINRLIAISDIHGHDEIFSDLLKKIALKNKDHLILLGDFLNKGTNSYATFCKINALSQHENIHILKGNHEYFIHHYLSTGDPDNKFLAFLKKESYETIIHSILASKGLSPKGFKSGNNLLKTVKTIEPRLEGFLNGLPIVLETKNFRFVHGGYKKTYDLQSDEVKFLKFDYFNQLSEKQDKTTVVGHWPCCLLRNRMLSNVPFVNPSKNLISIDGGLGVKATGELNAFIIAFDGGDYQYGLKQSNAFKVKKVIKTRDLKKEEPRFISYPNLEIELVQYSEPMSQYKHVMSGDIVSIPNILVVASKDKHELKINYVNRFFNVNINTEVEFCKKYGELALVKYNQEFGWLYFEDLI